MPKKSVITDQKKMELYQALEAAMPLSFACDLIGIPRQTVYAWMQTNPAFKTQIDIARAKAIQGLVEATGKQGGAWKLLKNLGKEEFKERVEVAGKLEYAEEVELPDGEVTPI